MTVKNRSALGKKKRETQNQHSRWPWDLWKLKRFGRRFFKAPRAEDRVQCSEFWVDGLGKNNGKFFVGWYLLGTGNPPWSPAAERVAVSFAARRHCFAFHTFSRFFAKGGLDFEVSIHFWNALKAVRRDRYIGLNLLSSVQKPVQQIKIWPPRTHFYWVVPRAWEGMRQGSHKFPSITGKPGARNPSNSLP